MMEVVTRENTHLYTAELAQMHRLRHRIFVERLGWEDLRSPDGVERDQFDTVDAIYLLLIDDGEVVGGHRLLPTLKPHLFSEVFPHLCDRRGVLRDDRVYELNRTHVDLVGLPPPKLLWARRANMIGLMEYGVRAGLTSFSVLTAPHFVSHYLALGWEIVPLGLPADLNGEQQVAIEIKCTLTGLEAMRAAYGMPGSVVRAVGLTLPELPGDLPSDTRKSEAVN